MSDWALFSLSLSLSFNWWMSISLVFGCFDLIRDGSADCFWQQSPPSLITRIYNFWCTDLMCVFLVSLSALTHFLSLLPPRVSSSLFYCCVVQFGLLKWWVFSFSYLHTHTWTTFLYAHTHSLAQSPDRRRAFLFANPHKTTAQSAALVCCQKIMRTSTKMIYPQHRAGFGFV